MIKLRDYQQYAVNSVFDYFAENEGNPLIALPTGTGKSLVLAGLIERILKTWPDQKVLCLTHVKELIEQDEKALLKLWPTAPSAVFSASLKRRDVGSVTFGGVATVHRSVDQFLDTNIILVDEAHLVSPRGNTMYRKLFETIRKHNPTVKIIGTTATVYRMGQGLLTEGDNALFDDVCCDMTDRDSFNWFIDQGYLSPLIPRPMMTEFDLSDVSTMNGDYKKDELAKAVDIDEVNLNAIDEIMTMGSDRKKWLLFATSIEHAEHLAIRLRERGIETGIVHSKMKDEKRDEVLNDFRAGKLRAVVNQNILTTGFDDPEIDLIAVLRPTKSASLWVQMLGRGTRPVYADGFDLNTKEGRLEAIKQGGQPDCLVLDFARNTMKLGPINDPVLPKPKGKKKGGVAPIKSCPECLAYNHATARICIQCGHEFERGVHLYTNSGTDHLIAPSEAKADIPEISEFEVDHVTYKVHEKNGFASLKVSYFCGLAKFDEYHHFERERMRPKAISWLKQRLDETPREFPFNTSEIISEFADKLKEPKAIKVHVNKEYPEVLNYVWSDEERSSEPTAATA